MADYEKSIRLSPINSGSVIYLNVALRGSGAFVPIEIGPFVDRRRTRAVPEAVAELSAPGAIPGIAQYVVAVQRYQGPELTLGLGIAVNHKRVARLMREAGIQGLYRRRRHGCTVRDSRADPYHELVDRDVVDDGPDELWMTDVTERSTPEGKVYCAAVLDAYSRRVWAGRSTTTCAPRSWWTPSEWRSPAVDPSRTRRSYIPITALNSPHGPLGNDSPTPGSIDSIGDCYDNSMVESFWAAMQLELLDSNTWRTRHELATAIFEWIESWCSPKRRHSSIGMLSPVDYAAAYTSPDHDH